MKNAKISKENRGQRGFQQEILTNIFFFFNFKRRDNEFI